jgi:aryl-alcohol dehydrogenase-like predicted oxidoreductase
MHYDLIGEVGPVSRLVMGAGSYGQGDDFSTYDEFFAVGGNCFDTAHIYGNGADEQMLGRWIGSRGARDEILILGKGAHTPWCTPEHVTTQLGESLERLQVDCIDIYLLHRDNRDVPVGEFLSVLTEHQQAGRIRAFGASNWEIDRLDEARRYAEANPLAGFSAVSNHFSLARMVEPTWAGVISAWDAKSRAWFTETQIPLVAWSSAAAGLFARPAKERGADWLRSWSSSDNSDRVARAEELAAKLGVTPVAVALAYVLRQPFPTFAIVGAKAPAHVHEAVASLDVELTVDQCAWLEGSVE